MSFERRLIALRHTSVGVPAGVCYGQMDVPLAATYPYDLGAVRSRLVPLTEARVISSPLQRCYRLATDLVRTPVQKDPRLMELSFGEWEGLLWSDIPREISEYWTEDVIQRAPPGGESFLQLIQRVQSFLEDPETWSAGPELLIVTHAGVIRALHHLVSGESMTACLHRPIPLGEHRVWDF